jgi:arylformamidase
MYRFTHANWIQFCLVLCMLRAPVGQAYEPPVGNSKPSLAKSIAPIDRYRLSLVREEALTRLDGKGITKLVEISRNILQSPSWTSAQEQELRKLLIQLESRYGLNSPESVPIDAFAEMPPFADPRREWLDIRYANSEGANDREQSLDVYAPNDGSDLPIVVWLHGGGMKGGDKSHPGITVLKPDFFNSRGFVFASLNYRLAPEQRHPAQAEDSAAAIAWLHDHAVEFGGDPNRIVLIGISAGAQLAAVISTNERFLAKHQKNLDIIKAAVILDIGSFDIPTLMEQAGERAPDMYRYTFRDGGNREDWIDCSPFYHVQRGKGIPAMLLYYVAGRDHHAVENQRFADRLTAEGYEAKVLAAEGKTHLSIELEIGTASDIPTGEILKFLEERL